MDTHCKNLYELLKSKTIYAILDGDTNLGECILEDGSSTKIFMPYLSGSDLCNISNLFGLPETYNWGGSNLSRWQYLDNLFNFCCDNNRCSDLFQIWDICVYGLFQLQIENTLLLQQAGY